MKEEILRIVTSIKEPLGIIGLILLIFFLLYKLVLEKKIFANLDMTSTIKILRLSITYVFILAIIVVIGMVIYKIVEEHNSGTIITPKPEGKLTYSYVYVLNEPEAIRAFLMKELGYSDDEAESKKYNPIINISVKNVGTGKLLLTKVEYAVVPNVNVPRTMFHSGTTTDPLKYEIDLSDLEAGQNQIVRELKPDDYSRILLFYGTGEDVGNNPLRKDIELKLTIYSDLGPLELEKPIEVALYSPSNIPPIKINKIMLDKVFARPKIEITESIQPFEHR